MIVTDRKRESEEKVNLLIDPELKDLKVLYFLVSFLFLTDYLMPQYFGVHLGWDLTCTRLGNMAIVFYMLLSPQIFTHFCTSATKFVFSIPLVLYLMVSIYTMVLRVDINAFFLIFMELLTLYLLIYGIRYVIGCKRALKWTIGCAYFLGVEGIVEFVYGKSLYLQFLSTMYTPCVNTYRSGHYRIMGPCGHPLAYGLFLILLIAIACVDIERDEIYLFQRPVLLVLLYLNVLLTGSRSTLGISGVEFLVILLLSNSRNIKKSLMALLAMIVSVCVFLLLTYKMSVGRYMLMQITSVIDQIFDTELAAEFGADVTTLNNSEMYREYLPRIFTLDWLNPIVGRGVKRTFGVEFDGVYIHSIDNYFVSQYIKFAYPGLVTYSIFILFLLITMIWAGWKYKSGTMKLLFVGTACYFYNLWWLDALQTLKYEYITVAMFAAMLLVIRQEKKDYIEKKHEVVEEIPL